MVYAGDRAALFLGRVRRLDEKHAAPEDRPVAEAEQDQRDDDGAPALPQRRAA